MRVEQLPDNGDGYSDPEPGSMAPIEYTFTVTINPCRLGRYQVQTAPARMTYIIGDYPQRGGDYSFKESLSECGYPAETQVLNQPGWLTHNEDDQRFTVGYFDDLQIAGIYNVTIKSIVRYPISP